MKLIVNADDFGLTKSVNLGIIEAHEHGIVKSTTIMCNMNYAEHAAEISKYHRDLGVGIHLVLTRGRPLSDNVSSLIDEEGNFLREKTFLESIDINHVKKEFQMQIDKIFSFGITPTHIDSHHHVHLSEKLFNLVEEFAIKYKVSLRVRKKENLNNKSIISSDFLIEKFYGDENITIDRFINILNHHSNYNVIEVMSHPGYLDCDTLNISSYNLQRLTELKTLTSKEVKNFIKEKKIQVINFRDLM